MSSNENNQHEDSQFLFQEQEIENFDNFMGENKDDEDNTQKQMLISYNEIISPDLKQQKKSFFSKSQRSHKNSIQQTQDLIGNSSFHKKQRSQNSSISLNNENQDEIIANDLITPQDNNKILSNRERTSSISKKNHRELSMTTSQQNNGIGNNFLMVLDNKGEQIITNTNYDLPINEQINDIEQNNHSLYDSLQNYDQKFQSFRTNKSPSKNESNQFQIVDNYNFMPPLYNQFPENTHQQKKQFYNYQKQQNSINSFIEIKKKVGHYIFHEKEPLFVSEFSELYMATSQKTKQVVIIRSIQKANITTYLQQRFIKEYKQLVKQSKTIARMVQVLDVFQTCSNFYIVYEYIKLPVLKTFCKKIGMNDTTKLLETFKLVLLIMETVDEIKKKLNVKQLVNLKFENIFYDQPHNKVKLTDFSGSYKQIKEELSISKKENLSGGNSKNMIAVITFQLYYGENVALFTKTPELFQKFSSSENRQTERMKWDCEEWCKKCLFNEDYSWDSAKEFLKLFLRQQEINLKKQLKQSQDQQQHKLSVDSKKNSRLGAALDEQINRNELARKSVQNSIRSSQGSHGSIFMGQSQHQLENKDKKGLMTTKILYSGYEYKIGEQFIRVKSNYIRETKIWREKSEFIRAKDFQSYYKDLNIYESVQSNTNYEFQIVQEIDDLPYFDIIETRGLDEEDNLAKYNFDIYEKLSQKRIQQFKVTDSKSNRIYTIKNITTIDDLEFDSIMQEISINLYLQYSDHTLLKLETFNNKLDQNQQKEDESTLSRTDIYLDDLYNKAITEINYNKSKFLQFHDVFLVKKEQNISFYLVFGDYDFSIKDYLLRNIKRQDTTYIKSEILMMAQQISELMGQLKKKGICHNNIAPENIFIQRIDEKPLIYLGNFEQAIIKQEKFKNMKIVYNKHGVNLKYKAPEIFNVLNLSESEKEIIICNPVIADIYSLGILLCEIKEKEVIHKRNQQEIFENLSFANPGEEIILLMINQKVQARMTLEKIKKFCLIHHDNITTHKQQQNIYKFKEISLIDMGEIEGDIAALLFARAYRRMQQFSNAYSYLTALQKKYIKNINRNVDAYKIEILLNQEYGNYYRDIDVAEEAIKNYQICISLVNKHECRPPIYEAQYLTKCALLQVSGGCIQWFKVALAIYRTILGTGNPQMMRLMINFGEAFELKNDMQNAQHIYSELMIVMKNSCGFEGPIGLKILDKMAGNVYYFSEYDNALTFFKQSLKIKEKLLFKDHPMLAESNNNCGECLRMLGSFYEANEIYEKALKIIWNQRSEYQDFLSTLYNNMGICYKVRGKIKQALKLYEESYRIKMEIYGKEAIKTLETLLNIAVLHDELSFHSKAIFFYDEIQDTLKAIKQTENTLWSTCLQNKGISYFNLAQYNKSLQNLNEAFQIKSKTYGYIHVSVAHTLQNLALVYHRQGNYKKSLQLYDDALKIYKKKLGTFHVFVQSIEANIEHTSKIFSAQNDKKNFI